MAGVAEETTRLPREKELGETPQGVLTTEEACQFPRRKASCFCSRPHPFLATDPSYLETESYRKGSFTLISTRNFNRVLRKKAQSKFTLSFFKFVYFKTAFLQTYFSIPLC
ncbi:hypothetical protein CEH05_08295 [Halobacillus halophilus]|nr:hypothetical protein CEH05_08295 [Halobacillus halophilus]